MRYYKNHWLYANNPLAGAYLRWAYREGIGDLTKSGFKPDFSREGFACLLCGVGNERTADEFIQFVFKRNPKVVIWIIDIAEENLKAVESLVAKKYSNLNIHIKKINALELLTFFREPSFDWIETDAFLEFFDNASLEKLLAVWYAVLKPDGFVTTRDWIRTNGWSRIIDPVRDLVMKGWLGVTTYEHTQKDFDLAFRKMTWKKIEASTFIPTYKRFSLIKDK